MQFRVALVHAKEIAREQRRLIAAGAGADFEDGALLVGGVLGNQQTADGLGQLLDAAVENLGLLARDRRHLGIAHQRVEAAALVLRRLQFADRQIHRLEFCALAAEPYQRLAVDRLRELAVDRLDPLDQGIDFFSWQHGARS